VKTLYLVEIGTVSPEALGWIQAFAVEWFPFPVRRMDRLPIPKEAYNASRGQYESVEVMKLLSRAAPRDAARILGVTEADLAIPMLSFLFGPGAAGWAGGGSVALPAETGVLRHA
jgi:archaemetzincin